jgi:hypothetical protein
MKLERLILLSFLFVAFAAGCNATLRTDYGTSEGSSARQSPAGVSLFRGICEWEGRQTLLVRSFSPRSIDRLQGLVWVPDKFFQHKQATYEWIDKWLATGGKTLIYVGRDFSPVGDYWSQVADQAMANGDWEDWLYASQQSAEQASRLDQMRASCRSSMISPWFLVEQRRSTGERVFNCSGPWASGFAVDQARIFSGSHAKSLDDFTKEDLQKLFEKPEMQAVTKPAGTAEFEREWQTNDDDMWNIVQALPEQDLPHLETWLADNDGLPLIAQVTMARWGNSQVIYLANASLISNVSLVNSQNRLLAKKLVGLLPPKGVGFVSGSFDPMVRTSENAGQQKGFEMLTIWPLNVITIHVVFLGMLMLVAVFPIFGRARLLPPKSTRDFGQHVEAMGALLYRTRDRFYALSTIADYFRIVRKEPTSPWANIDESNAVNAKSPFKEESPT